MHVKEIYPNLFLYTFPNQYDLASTFIRLQEFYESPYKQIKGKYFELEDYMDLYANDQKGNKFTYFEDWDGFNVPGNIIDNFLDKFHLKFTKKESLLLDELTNLFEEDKYYIIGVVNKGKDTIEHEIAHGLYYLNKDYRREMNKLIKNMPTPLKLRAEKYLIELGYSKSVIKDELQAYFATGLDKGMICLWHHILFQRYIQKIKREFKIYSNLTLLNIKD